MSYYSKCNICSRVCPLKPEISLEQQHKIKWLIAGFISSMNSITFAFQPFKLPSPKAPTGLSSIFKAGDIQIKDSQWLGFLLLPKKRDKRKLVESTQPLGTSWGLYIPCKFHGVCILLGSNMEVTCLFIFQGIWLFSDFPGFDAFWSCPRITLFGYLGSVKMLLFL